MAKTEASSRNGTLSINEQTRKQREMFSLTFASPDRSFGVSTSNSKILFSSSSPIGYDSDNDGLANRDDDVYSEYKNIIDNDAENFGFGFSDSKGAYMNYNHPDNPFIQGDYSTLTSGRKYADEDNERKAYRGFPDLDISTVDINAPADINVQNKSPESNLDLKPDGVSFGSSVKEYREKINDKLGKHMVSGNGNGDADTLGKYFTLIVEDQQ